MMPFGLLVGAVLAGSLGSERVPLRTPSSRLARTTSDALEHVARVLVRTSALGYRSPFLLAPEGGSDA